MQPVLQEFSIPLTLHADDTKYLEANRSAEYTEKLQSGINNASTSQTVQLTYSSAKIYLFLFILKNNSNRSPNLQCTFLTEILSIVYKRATV